MKHELQQFEQTLDFMLDFVMLRVTALDAPSFSQIMVHCIYQSNPGSNKAGCQGQNADGNPRKRC